MAECIGESFQVIGKDRNEPDRKPEIIDLRIGIDV